MAGPETLICKDVHGGMVSADSIPMKHLRICLIKEELQGDPQLTEYCPESPERQVVRSSLKPAREQLDLHRSHQDPLEKISKAGNFDESSFDLLGRKLYNVNYEVEEDSTMSKPTRQTSTMTKPTRQTSTMSKPTRQTTMMRQKIDQRPTGSKGPMRCCVCGKKFRQMVALMRHEESHEQSHRAVESINKSPKNIKKSNPGCPSLLKGGRSIPNLTKVHPTTESDAIIYNTSYRSASIGSPPRKNKTFTAKCQDPLRKPSSFLKNKVEMWDKDKHLSKAWDILCSHDENVRTHIDSITVSHCQNKPSDLKKNVMKPSFVRTELLGVNLSDQERIEMMNVSRMLNMISILGDKLTGITSAFPKPSSGNNRRKNTESQIPVKPEETVRKRRNGSSSSSKKSKNLTVETQYTDEIKDIIEFDQLESDYVDSSKCESDSSKNDCIMVAEAKQKAVIDDSRKCRRKRLQPERVFCNICQKDFKDIKKHMLIHNSVRSFKCKACGKAYYEKHVLLKHQMTHVKRFKCSVCGEHFSHLRAARRHAKVHMAEKPYICEVCKYQSRTRRELRAHMYTHSDIKRFMCHICGHGSCTSQQFRAHQRCHTDEKAFVCEVCGKAFKHSSGLRTHSFSHTSGKPYRCQICSESFKHNYLLKRHMLDHEGEKLDKKQPSLVSPDMQDSTLSQENKGDSAGSLVQAGMTRLGPDVPTTEVPDGSKSSPLIQTVLGRDLLSQNLENGPGSRNQTVEHALVEAICDGSFRALRQLQKVEEKAEEHAS